LGAAALVIIFGLYRIKLSFRNDEEDERARAKKGLYAMSRRSHRLVGIVYLLLGGFLIAASFGWNPVGKLIGPSSESPKTPAAAPTTK
jgi:hypothetical protein